MGIMGFVVKSTIHCGLLDLLCPLTCRNCGQLGAVLCDCCKKNIVQSRVRVCPLCKQMVAKKGENVENVEASDGWRCEECEMPFWGLWVAGWREEALATLIKDFKYHSLRAAAGVLAEILDVALPTNEELKRSLAKGDTGLEVVIVPLPTIGRHVRERGLDHTKILARKLAKRRGWKCQSLLGRAVDTVQVGAKVAQRQEQAERTYEVVGRVDADKLYVLLDDVWTTGATMLAAAKVLRRAGAEKVCGAVLATGRPKEEASASEQDLGV